MAILNVVNLYDINIIAEDFFPGLLNLIYGYELQNANHFEKMLRLLIWLIRRIG